jgi:hypothetical protein
VQIEQRLLQRRVDHRLPLAARFGISLQSLHVLSSALAQPPIVVSVLDSAPFLKRSTIGRTKKAT